MSSSVEDLYQALERLHLTRYEAKSYVALLAMGQGNGYSIAKTAGIPVSKIYSVLGALCAKGFALSDGTNKPVYQPASHQQTIELFKGEMESGLKTLTKGLQEIASRAKPLRAVFFDRKQTLEKKLDEVVASAKHQILISGWPDEIAGAVAKRLASLPKKVRKYVLSYGALSVPGAEMFIHRNAEQLRKEFADRCLLVIADSSQVLAGFYQKQDQAQGFWMESRPVARIFADFFVHDVSINLVMKAVPPENYQELEDNITLLRKTLSH